MKNQLKGTIILLLAALIWGCAFVAQSSAADSLGTFTIQSMRSFIAGAALIPVVLIIDKLKKQKQAKSADNNQNSRKMLIIGGVVCGGILTLASCLQQFGIGFTTPGKAGFITALYILFVPIIGLFLKRKVPWHIWICIALGVVGLYLLCMTDKSFSLSFGDTYVLLCAVVFAIHIIAVDYFVQFSDGVKLSCIQFFVSGLISMIFMFIFENPSISAILSAAATLLFLGLISSGVGYTLQIVGQKHCTPTVASLAMSFESVFAVIGEFVIFGLIMHKDVSMNTRELFGCIIMFAAIIISQLPIDRLTARMRGIDGNNA